MKLSTTLNHILTIPNQANARVVRAYHEYLKSIETSENYQNQNLKQIIVFARHLGKETTFYNIEKKEQILEFLDTKIKQSEVDPDKKWITTWNDYLWRIKYFFRWFHNYKVIKEKGNEPLDPSEWHTPSFALIKKKKTKRLSPYTESELWNRDELLSVIRYEPYKRNKAAIALLWDLDARPHEITLLRIKHIRLRDRYGEGEVPHQAKTGGGPVLLTCSFPYVRDWLNEHPFRNEPDARLICNLLTGAPIKADGICTIMKQLRGRIIRLLHSGTVFDQVEKDNLEFLIKSKKWNPYCIRHSAITSDSDYLPEYALKKKVRWSMNSRQGTRYIKGRMGNDLKEKILTQNGILPPEELKGKPSVHNCARCGLVNAIENKYCSKCSYPLTPAAFEEIKLEENRKMLTLNEKYEGELRKLREDVEMKLSKILAKIDMKKLA